MILFVEFLFISLLAMPNNSIRKKTTKNVVKMLSGSRK